MAVGEVCVCVCVCVCLRYVWMNGTHVPLGTSAVWKHYGEEVERVFLGRRVKENLGSRKQTNGSRVSSDSSAARGEETPPHWGDSAEGRSSAEPTREAASGAGPPAPASRSAPTMPL